MIRMATIEDAKQLVDIYNYYVLNSVVTFDDEPLSLVAFQEKMNSRLMNMLFQPMKNQRIWLWLSKS